MQTMMAYRKTQQEKEIQYLCYQQIIKGTTATGEKAKKTMWNEIREHGKQESMPKKEGKMI